MNEDHVKILIEEMMEENGCSIESLSVHVNGNGFEVDIKASGNPFEPGDFTSEAKEMTVVPLRGRECKYHSARMGVTGFYEEKAEGKDTCKWLVAWTSEVSSWDEYTDAEDTHTISAQVGLENDIDDLKSEIRKEFEEHLISEIVGDFYHIGTIADHLTLPINDHYRQSVMTYLAGHMRKFTCL